MKQEFVCKQALMGGYNCLVNKDYEPVPVRDSTHALIQWKLVVEKSTCLTLLLICIHL